MGVGVWGNEFIWLISLNMFMVALASVLYAMGGTNGFHKLVRRLGSSVTLGVAINGTSAILGNWCWQFFIIPIILFVIYTEPYGADSLNEKFWRRSVFAMSFVLCYFLGMWANGFTPASIIVFHLSSIAVALTVPLGIWNPFNNAPLEQAIICYFSSIFLISLPFVR